MAPQFMAFLFEPSVRGLSLRCNLNNCITSLDALMILQSWLGGSLTCRKTINTLKKVRKKLKQVILWSFT